VVEYDVSLRVLKVVVKTYSVTCLAQNAGQHGLANLNRLPAQIGAVESEQVEGVQEGDCLVAAPAQHVKPGEPALITADYLSVDQA
jgi:hypothetical protein